MQLPARPHFSPPILRTILRYPSNEPCELQSLDSSMQLTNADIEAVVNICNEKLVYNVLFSRILNGQPYSKAGAERFFAWACEGWDTNSWFVFIIRNSRKDIIAAIDIKSNTTDAAETGYWASASSPGIMTNAMFQLCDLAKEAGYRSLYALVAP